MPSSIAVDKDIQQSSSIIGRPSNVYNYPRSIKRQAIALYAMQGNAADIARQMEIGERVLRKWVASPWGQAEIQRIQQDNQHILDSAMTRVIHKGVEVLEDRLQHGDYRTRVLEDSEGNQRTELVRVPIDGVNAAKATAYIFDRRQILRNAPTSITSNNDNNGLAKLAETLKSIALQRNTGKIIQGTVIDSDTSVSKCDEK